jgi:hypothetical protein
MSKRFGFRKSVCIKKINERRNRMKKFLALVLVLLTLIPLFVACKDGEDPVDDDPNETTDPTTDPYYDGVPTVDYQELAFEIAVPWVPTSFSLDWGVSAYFQEEDSSEAVESAIYKRNSQIERRFNIKISTVKLGDTRNHVQSFQTYALANQDVLDVLALGYYDAGKGMIMNDYVLPWEDVPYINLEKSWWQDGLKNMSICGNTYFIVGDFNWWYMQEVPVCYFNKDIATDYETLIGGNLYEMVDDNEWTFDRCYEIAKSFSNSEDGVWDANDRYGAIINNMAGTQGFVAAANYITATMEDDGPKLNFMTNDLSKIIKYINDFCNGGEHASYFVHYDDTNQAPEVVEMFFDQRALFLFDILLQVKDFRSQENSDFGIIPYPKYNAKTQKNYTNYTHTWSLCTSIPCTATNLERTGGIVEALCALSGKLVVPAYYERALMAKYKRDDESEDMLEIIFANVIYDYGVAYSGDQWSLMPGYFCPKSNATLNGWYRLKENPLKTSFWELYEYVYEKEYGVKPEKPDRLK